LSNVDLHDERSIMIIFTGVGSGGYAGDLTPQLFMWGDIDMYIPLGKLNT